LATSATDGSVDAGCGDAGTTCAMGVETTCLPNGTTTKRPCPFGCAGDACAGTCGGMGGADLVTQLTLKGWSTVTLDTAGSKYDTLLYLRKTCNTPGSELPLAGPCMGGNPLALTTMCIDDPMMGVPEARLVACGLPAGTYFPWLDAKAGGGLFTLDVKISPVTLLDCATGGNLLDGG